VRLHLLWVGRTQEDWLKRGIEEYAGRIRRYNSLEILEAKEEKGAQAETGRYRECERLARLLPKGGKLVLLDERGRQMSSPQFASFIGQMRDAGTSDLCFAIGGAYGFSETFRQRADAVMSLSTMTFTHQMVRLFLLEQMYRGFTILNGEHYHH
jgi:23S rRNA (pseudouridine1915-N3)-methyltransferase